MDLLCQFTFRGNEFFSAAVFAHVGFCCLFVITGWKQRFEKCCCLLHFFFHIFSPFVPFFFFSFPGTNLHDGLWHSVNINARRHRITLTLDNNAATASHATTVSRIYSGNSYYFGGKLFQIDIGQVFMMEILRF